MAQGRILDRVQGRWMRLIERLIAGRVYCTRELRRPRVGASLPAGEGHARVSGALTIIFWRDWLWTVRSHCDLTVEMQQHPSKKEVDSDLVLGFFLSFWALKWAMCM
ncbi:hypothetical protein V6N13_139838 [Hibiscus sabdariffa]